jgi:hypothetical protein
MLSRFRWIIMVCVFLGITWVVRLQPDNRTTVRPSGGSSEPDSTTERTLDPTLDPRTKDRSPAAWRARVEAYRLELEALERSADLEAGSLAAAIEALRARHFEGSEITRIRDLDDARGATSGAPDGTR